MKLFSICIRIFPFLHTVFHSLIQLPNISCTSTICYVQLGTERRVPQLPSLLQQTGVPHCNCASHPIYKPPARSPWGTWHQLQKTVSFLLSATMATENKEQPSDSVCDCSIHQETTTEVTTVKSYQFKSWSIWLQGLHHWNGRSHKVWEAEDCPASKGKETFRNSKFRKDKEQKL